MGEVYAFKKPRRRVRSVRRSAVGTILGAPSIADLEDFCAAQSYMLAQFLSVKACVNWATSDPAGYGDWAARVHDAASALSVALENAYTVIDATPEAMRGVMPALVAWDHVAKEAKPFAGLLREMSGKGCTPPDFSQMPQPKATDVDLTVYNWAGRAMQMGQGIGGVVVVVALILLAREMRF